MSFYNGILNHDDIHESGVRGPPGIPGVGYKLDSYNNYDIENKKLVNVKAGTNANDVVIKSQIQYLDGVNPGQVINNKAVIYSNSGSIHSNALYLKDQYGQEVIFHTEDQDDNQIRLYIPNLKNNDSFGGRLKSSFVITSINQIIQGKKIFHDIEVPTPTINGHASNKAYVDNEISKISDASDNSNYVRKSGDTMTGPLIVQKDDYPIQGDLNKVISYETQQEIFLSKREGGKMLQPIDMNGFSIDNLPLPTANDHACNKKYVDNEINKITTIDTTLYLKRDGSIPLLGTLNMNGNRIYKLPDPQLSDEPATLGYVSQLNNNLFNSYLDLKGPRKMEGNLNMDNHKITNIKTPSDDSDAVNKGYIDINMIQSAHPPKNILSYIMDDVDQTSSEYGIEIDKIDDYNDSFHSYNKKVIYLKLIKNGNNYRSRIGYNIFKLIDKSKDTFHTAVIEWLTTDNNAWTKIEIFNNITSGSIISNQTKKFENGKGLYYTRSIIQFEVMSITSPPIYLLSTIHIDGVNQTYPAKFNEVYNIIYGVNGSHAAIGANVYDYHDIYEIKNGKMTMKVDIDMNRMSILNIGNLNNRIHGMVNNVGRFTNSSIRVDLKNVFINYVLLAPSSVYKSTLDNITFNTSGLENLVSFSFRYSDGPGLTKIKIDRRFNHIVSIQLAKARNIPFKITFNIN